LSKLWGAVQLYYFQELSYQEIAEVLKIPIATVGVRIKRAKEAIKEITNSKNKKYEPNK